MKAECKLCHRILESSDNIPLIEVLRVHFKRTHELTIFGELYVLISQEKENTK